jgi:hypothetical protein
MSARTYRGRGNCLDPGWSYSLHFGGAPVDSATASFGWVRPRCHAQGIKHMGALTLAPPNIPYRGDAPRKSCAHRKPVTPATLACMLGPGWSRGVTRVAHALPSDITWLAGRVTWVHVTAREGSRRVREKRNDQGIPALSGSTNIL